MNSLKQIFMEIIRRPFRNILIIFTVFVLAFFCITACFLDSAIESFHHAFSEMSGYCMVVEIDAFSKLSNWNTVIVGIMENEHVISYNNAIEKQAECQPVDFSNVSYDGTVYKNGENNRVFLLANIDTSCCDYFRNEQLKLVDGSYPTGQDRGVVIDKNLAQANGLGIGDFLCVELYDSKIQLEITGLYETLQVPQVEAEVGGGGYYRNSSKSFLFCDYNSFIESGAEEDCRMLLFYVDDYKNMQKCCQYAEHEISDIENTLVMDVIAGQEIQMSHVFVLVRQMAGITIRITYMLCTAIMALMMVLWLRSHSGMIVIYRTLGQNSAAIVVKLLLESILLTVPILILTFCIGGYVIHEYAESIFFRLLKIFWISSVEQQFAANHWNFHMDYIMMGVRLGILEAVILLIVLLVAVHMIRMPVRSLRSLH